MTYFSLMMKKYEYFLFDKKFLIFFIYIKQGDWFDVAWFKNKADIGKIEETDEGLKFISTIETV